MRNAFFRVLDKLAPPLTIRRQFLALSRQVPSTLLNEGLFAVLRRTYDALCRYRATGALLIADVASTPVRAAPPDLPPFPYAEWIAANEPNDDDLERQRSAAAD